MTNAILRGKPDKGRPHVRFGGGKVASAKPRRGLLLYMAKGFAVFLAGVLCTVAVEARALPVMAAPLEPVVFDSPAENDRGLMILGNGEVGSIVWISKDAPRQTTVEVRLVDLVVTPPERRRDVTVVGEP